jgi:RTX calcium-binding nonapeptide repeat (4 copies)
MSSQMIALIVGSGGNDRLNGGDGADYLWGCSDILAAQNNDGQRSNLFHHKRILTRHRLGCYRSAYLLQAANTEWRIAV